MQREHVAVSGRPCGACGEGHFQQADVKGRAFAYRDERALVLRSSLVVPICDVCGELRESRAHADSLDILLEAEYTAKRIAATKEMVATLISKGWRQAEIEQVMALSAGYLSKALRGEKTLATSTLRHLHAIGCPVGRGEACRPRDRPKPAEAGHLPCPDGEQLPGAPQGLDRAVPGRGDEVPSPVSDLAYHGRASPAADGRQGAGGAGGKHR